MSEKVVVMMSGGVDSSMAAVCLLEQGYEVIGATLRQVVEDPNSANRQVAEAQAVADRIGIPHETVDSSEAFQKDVVEPFIAAYCAGRTPNPCFHCNPGIKFRLGLELADRLGARWLATGHYARIIATDSGPRLARAAHRSKDQSYFLAGLPARMIQRIQFPLGEFSKKQVRDLAKEHGLRISERKESQEICFTEAGDVHAFFAGRDLSQAGDIVNTEGDVLGRHRGIVHYTIGQRRGLGLAGGPYYVMELDAETNRVVVGRHDDLYTREVEAVESNYLAPVREGMTGEAKIRSRHRAAKCRMVDVSEGSFRIRFDEPQWGVAPGQALVVYDGDYVLAGGVIESGTQGQ